MTLRVVNDGADAQEHGEDSIGREIAAAAQSVHAALGAGLPENIYVRCLEEELRARGVIVEAQVSLPVVYRDRKFSNAFTLDLLVQGSVIVQVKTADSLSPAHEAQLHTYMKHADADAGYLVNFNAPVMKDGVKRLVRRKKP